MALFMPTSITHGETIVVAISMYDAFIIGVGFTLGSLVVAGTKAVLLFTIALLVSKKGG